MVAEDSPTTHEILKLLLTQRGHHVDIATDGEQALEALRLNRYDVALLDFHLPKMNGLRVASTVRSELHGRDLLKSSPLPPTFQAFSPTLRTVRISTW